MNPAQRGACLSLPLFLGLNLTACGPGTVVDQRSSRVPAATQPPQQPDSAGLRPAPAYPQPDSAGLRPAPAYPAAGSLERVPQPRGGLEDPQPPRPVAPPPRPPTLPPGQTTRLGIGPPPPEVIHPARSATGSSRENPAPPAPTSPAPRRQIPAK